MNLIKRLFIYLDERFSKLSVTSLRAQYYVILIGHCRFRYIFSRCIYCDDVPWPISVLLPSRYQRTIDFIVSFYGHLSIYPPALFIYLHTRTDCDQCCVVVLIYVLAIDLFRRCLFTHVRMFIQPTLCCDKRGGGGPQCCYITIDFRRNHISECSEIYTRDMTRQNWKYLSVQSRHL